MFSKKLSAVIVLCFGTVLSEPPALPQYGPPPAPFPQYGPPPSQNGAGGSPLPPPPLNGIGGPGLPPPPLNGIGGPGLPPPSAGGFGPGGPNYNYEGNNVDGHDDHHDHSPGMGYEFGYQVKDEFSGNNYGRQEKSDGNQVRGEYSVQLPDGRVQIVTYYADWQTGFHADVRYEGQARYPGPNNGNGIPNQYEAPGIDNRGGFDQGPGRIPPGGPGLDVDRGSFAEVPGGTRYGTPRVDVDQRGYNEIPSGNRFDNRNSDRGYNYNNNNGGSVTGYAPVNDGINFDDSYGSYNYNRNKPLPVYGAP